MNFLTMTLIYTLLIAGMHALIISERNGRVFRSTIYFCTAMIAIPVLPQEVHDHFMQSLMSLFVVIIGMMAGAYIAIDLQKLRSRRSRKSAG